MTLIEGRIRLDLETALTSGEDIYDALDMELEDLRERLVRQIEQAQHPDSDA